MPETAKHDIWDKIALGVFALLGYLVFTGIVVYVKDFKYSHPSVPTGNYSPVRVLSSGLDGGAYVFTMKRLADQTLTPDSFMKEKESGEDAGYPAPGIIYTMECTPHFWNLAPICCRDKTTMPVGCLRNTGNSLSGSWELIDTLTGRRPGYLMFGDGGRRKIKENPAHYRTSFSSRSRTFHGSAACGSISASTFMGTGSPFTR